MTKKTSLHREYRFQKQDKVRHEQPSLLGILGLFDEIWWVIIVDSQDPSYSHPRLMIYIYARADTGIIQGETDINCLKILHPCPI